MDPFRERDVAGPSVDRAFLRGTAPQAVVVARASRCRSPGDKFE